MIMDSPLTPGPTRTLGTAPRTLARYYTPETVAQALADWAITDSTSTVLDPCFGGCSFFRATVNALARQGARSPARLLYGVDKDRRAREHLLPLLGQGALPDHFVTADFLAVRPQELKGFPFGAVVGNPPYIRHHRIRGKSSLRKFFVPSNGFFLSGRASYWAYFLLHALDFVAPGGKMAMVLPGAFLHADYAEVVRRAVLESFSNVTVVVVRERLFADAEEVSVLLMAEGRGQPHRELRVGIAESAGDVATVCKNIESHTKIVRCSQSSHRWLSTLIGTDALELYSRLAQDTRTVPLGDLAEIRIGTVTGCNELFVISDALRQQLGLPQAFVREIVDRAAHLPGLSFAARDHYRLLKDGHPSLLLSIPERAELSAALATYLETGRQRQIHTRYKCKVRSPWFCVRDAVVPNAFLHYMSSGVPHLVLNSSGATCTNAIHRLKWKKRLSPNDQEWIALSSLSTLCQLGAELNGRWYGGGVLKLEPKQARTLLLVKPPAQERLVGDTFRAVDSLLRKREIHSAVELVDEVILINGLGLVRQDVDMLARACTFLRKLRFPPSRNLHPKIDLSGPAPDLVSAR
jgi:hypothetical protein